MFQRRHRKTFPERCRDMLWPTMGLKRTGIYWFHRLMRTSSNPATIAAGFAHGVAISFTPFLGLHTLAALVLCKATKASLSSAVIGTLLAGNVWTLPLALLASFSLGQNLLNLFGWSTAEMTRAFTLHHLEEAPQDYFLPTLLGSIPLFVLSWTVSFFALRAALLSRTRRKATQSLPIRGAS